jgi:hypothetical protein
MKIAERFWKRVTRGEPGECWNWRGTLNRLGYGQIGRGAARNVGAHRVSYELHFGPIPAGAHILHSCDNRACVNPAHLRPGTHAENMRDRSERGRVNAARGSKAARAKLTEDVVAVIKARLALHHSGSTIALELGVDKGTISCIKRGKTWRHVPPAML